MVQALGVVLQSNKYWEEPEKFKPERFITKDDNGNENNQQWAFKPFGVGTRMCPASKYPIYVFIISY